MVPADRHWCVPEGTDRTRSRVRFRDSFVVLKLSRHVDHLLKTALGLPLLLPHTTIHRPFGPLKPMTLELITPLDGPIPRTQRPCLGPPLLLSAKTNSLRME